LTISGSNVLSLSPPDWLVADTYSVELDVSFDNYPDVKHRNVPFAVTIINPCKADTITGFVWSDSLGTTSALSPLTYYIGEVA